MFMVPLRFALAPELMTKSPQALAVAVTPEYMLTQELGLIVTDVPLAPVCKRDRKVSSLSTMAEPLVIASKVPAVAFQRTFESAPVLMVRLDGAQPESGATVTCDE
jgi:hypothetical protein